MTARFLARPYRLAVAALVPLAGAAGVGPGAPAATAAKPAPAFTLAALFKPPPVPAGTLAFDSNRTGSFQIFTMNADGTGTRQLTFGDQVDSWWARISPDRSRILFYRTPAGVPHDQSFDKTSLWVMNPDGSQQVQLRAPGANGWQVQAQAQWSPDGTRMVMTGGATVNPQIFVTDATGQSPRQVTFRSGVNVDPTWSPDGATIAFVGCPVAACYPEDYEIYRIPVSGAALATRVTNDKLRDNDPQFSPDGTRIAWLTQTATTPPVGEWNSRLALTDGTGMRWITRDSNVNSRPEWSRDGTAIYFHRLDFSLWPWFNLYRIRPDGTGLTILTNSQMGSNEYPST